MISFAWKESFRSFALDEVPVFTVFGKFNLVFRYVENIVKVRHGDDLRQTNSSKFNLNLQKEHLLF